MTVEEDRRLTLSRSRPQVMTAALAIAVVIVLLTSCGLAKKGVGAATTIGSTVPVTSPASTVPTTSSGSAFAIDMTKATQVACPPPAGVSTRNAKPVLAAVFDVHDGGTPYVLGWQIIPYLGASRTYRLGVPGDLLVLAGTNNSPLGFGTGTFTLGSTPYAGSLHAVIKLTAGGSLTIGGSWRCTTHV